jgi:hypothetical protein
VKFILNYNINFFVVITHGEMIAYSLYRLFTIFLEAGSSCQSFNEKIRRIIRRGALITYSEKYLVSNQIFTKSMEFILFEKLQCGGCASREGDSTLCHQNQLTERGEDVR